MVSSEMLRRVALVRTDVSEEHSATFIRVTRISELGTTLAVTSNPRTLVFLCSVCRLLVTANVPSSQILVTLMKEALGSSETSVLTKATQRNIPYDVVLQQSNKNLRGFWSASELYRLSDRHLLAKFCAYYCRNGQRVGSPTVVNLSFLDRSRYFSCYSENLDAPVNRTQDLWVCSQGVRPLDHRGGPLYNNTVSYVICHIVTDT
jgi:hypothetical protein